MYTESHRNNEVMTAILHVFLNKDTRNTCEQNITGIQANYYPLLNLLNANDLYQYDHYSISWIILCFSLHAEIICINYS